MQLTSKTLSFLLLCLAIGSQGLLASASNWPQFLGPEGLGNAGDQSIPLEFNADKNLLWKVKVPKGNASPIIWGDQIFLTAFEGESRIMMAIDRRTGSVLWKKTVQAQEKESFTHRLSGPAESTPCTDGKHVYFYFGNYGLVALNFDGSLAWEKILPKPRTGMGTGTSPILHKGLLILNRDSTNDPCILALDTENGEEIWKHPRIGYNSSHASPFIWKNKLRTELVVAGTRSLVSLEPTTGKLIWKVEDTNGFPCTSPVGTPDRLFFASWSAANANSREKLEAHFDDELEITDEEMNDPELFFNRFDKNGDGALVRDELPKSRAKDVFKWLDQDDNEIWEQDEFEILTRPAGRGRNIMVAVNPGGSGILNGTDYISWESSKHLPYVASPLVSENRVYLVKSMGLISCLNTETGTSFYSGLRTGEKCEYFSSPILADGKLVICSNYGTVFIIKDSEAFEILATNSLEEEIISTPAVSDNTLYIRSLHSLWAFKEHRTGAD
ncbi:PQQ-binding-like beta-propeller repeat protein [Opitutia bacterium ISCC 51]|nr:PQQ-binding-like beta-propeller repeat protein [Opitutae bacterium ISCC 51]QXD26701.1 PQQ-binding-like beta-propeller repeat protein [Opitutae bacterium ISCC 52]